MADLGALSDLEREFLAPFLPPSGPASRHSLSQHNEEHELPFVTLTYAQSMDSMIASAPGERTTLSGMETKSMTHFLRTNHSAILVGAGTAAADDPGLNSRYPGTDLAKQPLPVIVDPHERWKGEPEPKVVQLAREERGYAPIWVTSNPRYPNWTAYEDPKQRAGHARLPVFLPLQEDGRWDWYTLLRNIKLLGCNSVMIEGGATIINELLNRPNLVDSVIVTIAPTWLGTGGVTVTPAEREATQEGTATRVNAATMIRTSWMQFGQDVVVCGRLQRHL